eukprot:CAMPEP_0172328756 /NCGR_PEP_ID=MMETSP1058-20130122/60518_1 /TAXON_ID=83371 /ORGANISM="Detonula confervacea, Strain CCMP 353" /LENGTH=1426 /DNA_ID=CAMNT_0013045885 /DNA_START=107 /DNA_END=4387 /DNA_ORIENTATION=+
MVQTPLRRSRRVKAQSDDEASVASVASSTRTSKASNKVTTPTRRSTRATRATKGGKSASATKKELEAIPEAIAIAAADEIVGVEVAVVVATPAKSAKKKKKNATPAKASEETKVEETKEETKTSGDGSAGVDDTVVAVAATPAKSAKKKKNKNATPSKATEEAQVEETKEENKISASGSVGLDDVVVSATPAKSAKKQKKKSATPSKATEEAQVEKEATEPKAASPMLTPPPTKSSKKKKKRKSLDAVKVADVSSDKASTPKVDSKVIKETEVEKEATESSVTSALTPPPTKSSKKKKKRKSLDAVKVADVSSDKASTPKVDSKVIKETEVEKEATESSVTSALTPPPTKSSKKKKRSKKSLDAEEVAAVSSDKVSTRKSAGKKATETMATTSTLTPPTKSSKKKKKNKDAASPSQAVSGENSVKKPWKRNAKETQPSSSSASALTTTKEPKSSKKERRNKVKNAEAADDSSAKLASSEVETEATSKRRIKRLLKSNPNAPEITPKRKTSTKKKSSKTPKKKSTSNKKHDRPTVSPKRKRPSKVSSQALQSHPPLAETPKLVMDVKVHRMRFLKLHPKSILSMSCTPLDSSTTAGSPDQQQPRAPVRLAISREGGSVELLSPQDRWVSVGDVPGVRGREVDALVWVCGKQGKSEGEKSEVPESSLGSQLSDRVRLVDEQRHLFGCSRDGTIFELDFATKRQKGVIGSGGGGVFCLATMCSRGKCCCSQGNNGGSCGGYFAAGCEDGSVKIYSAFGGIGGETVTGIPQLVATLPSAGNAILSLAWVPGQSGNDDGGMGGSVIFAGVADGTIRRFDCTTSITTGPISTGTVLAPSRGSASISYRWKSTLRMTVENRGLREATKVWALEALSDGTVISGDSLGHIQIWDGMSGTMTQTFDHNESDADVLCLAVSEDENKIFASGIDSSVRCIERQCSPPTADGPQNVTFESTPVRKWISSNSHRKHSHDVKALAICHKETSTSSKPLELLVSGSVDTRICTYVTKDFKSSRPKVWYNWPSLSPISVSRKQRLLAVTRDNRIDLYHVNSHEMVDPLKNMNPETRDEAKCLVKTISIKSPFNLSCSVISDDGKFLAASDAVSLYVFSLEVEEEDGLLDVHPTKLVLSRECKHPATALKFDDRGRLICATNNGSINILKISPVSETDSPDGSTNSVSLEHVFKEHTLDWSAASHHFPIVSLDLSSDGKWLAAGRFSSGKGAVHVFTLPTNNDDGRYQHWWSVPEMDAPTTCIKFLGGGSVESSLAVGCSNNEFYIYNLGRRSLSHWSNDMGLPLLKSLPKELTTRSEPVARIVSNPVSPQRFILGSHGYFCVVDLDQPVPERSSMFPPDHLRARRLEQIKEDDTLMHCAPPRKKSKKNVIPGTSTNFTICLRYSEMLFQDFISENEMIIVEEPWTSILDELPDALARRVYGT